MGPWSKGKGTSVVIPADAVSNTAGSPNSRGYVMSDPLEQLYAEATKDDVFFAEYAGMPAAAGDLRDIVVLAQEANDGEGMEPDDLIRELVDGFMGAIIDLCVLGTVKGEDRVANCQSAWDAFKVEREAGRYPRTVAAREALGLPIADRKRLGTF